MRKDIVLVGMKTNEETGKAVSSLDGAVQDMVAALDSGMVRPSASGLVNTTSGIVRDVSGLVRDASGLVRDLTGAVKDDATAEHYKKIVQMIQDLCKETECFSRYCLTFTDLARREEPGDMTEDALQLICDVCSIVRNASHISSAILKGVESGSEIVHVLIRKVESIKEKVTELEKCSELMIEPEETSIMFPDASGLVRDISGVVRDISGLVRGNGWR